MAILIEMRTCSGCGYSLPATAEFWCPRKYHPGKFHSPCRACRRILWKEWARAHPSRIRVRSKNYPKKQTKEYFRNYQLMHDFGISLEEYNAIKFGQDNCCAICGVPENAITGRTPTLHVDHDHDTGVIRGLLCWKCNLGLGNFDDNPTFLSNAIAYLASKEG